MLDLYRSTIDRSRSAPITDGKTVSVEGSALIAVTNNNEAAVENSTGVADEFFAGISLLEPIVPSRLPKVETLLIEDNTVELAREPVSGTLAIWIDGTEITEGDPATTATEYSISDKTVTFHTDQEGETARVAYRYEVTVSEAISVQGNGQGSFTYAGDYLGWTGVIEAGTIYTSEFDTTVDWTQSPVAVTLGTSGLFTIGGTGTTINASVVGVPVSDQQFLGLRVNV